MEAFLHRQNIDRFRKLLETTTDESQRATLIKLLKEEEEKERTAQERLPVRPVG